MSSKELVISAFVYSISGFIYYDRKEDNELPRGAVQEAIKNGDITIEELQLILAKEIEIH